MRHLLALILAACLLLSAGAAEDFEEMTLEEGDVLPEEAQDSLYVQRAFAPSCFSPYTVNRSAGDYWSCPMDITDVDAVWRMLQTPSTVLDTGEKNAQRIQVVLRAEPNSKSSGVGVVTCISQGVRVLEPGAEWTKIECYSSSFHDSRVKAWNSLVQGWVPTAYLKKVTPDPHIGYVADKLTQRLYVFVDGELYDTLLISTGLANADQPYNETRSGEFFLQVPAMGGFYSGNLFCAYGLRFNSGDAMHQVPYVETADGFEDFSTTEYRLGTRASHGCIRVQRKQTPKGTNMKWVWDHKANNIKFVIWEDWQGRQILPPSDGTVLYYNPNGGSLYHTAETCYSAREGITFSPFTYGQLEEEGFRRLKRCTYCTPPLRLSEIAEINEKYLPGADHDPVMTRALKKKGLIRPDLAVFEQD